MTKRRLVLPFSIFGYFPPLGGGGGGGADHNLLSATHLDTVVGSPVRGDLVIANSTPAWAKTALGATGRVIRSNALDAIWDVLQHGDLGGVGANDHHTQLHRIAHEDGSGDAFASATSIVSLKEIKANLATAIGATPILGTQALPWSDGFIDIVRCNTINKVSGLPGVITIGGSVNLSDLGSDPAAAGDIGYRGTRLKFKDSGATVRSLAHTDDAAPAHNILSSSHDATVAAAAAGDVIRRNTGNTAWERLAIGATGDVLQVSGGLPVWASSPPPAGSMGLTRLSLAADGSGAAGADATWVVMTSDKLLAATGLQTLFTITGVGTGTWHAVVIYRYQSDVATSGAGFAGNHTGTIGFWVSNVYVITTGGTAATGTHDQATTTAGGQMAEGKAERVKNTLSSTLAGVDTINSDMLAVMHLLFEVTATGSLVIQGAGEAANDITFKAGTVLELHKIA